MSSKLYQKQTGFTIVELLIVIVVIGILAAITIVAYNGIQNRGKDAQIDSSVNQIKKALEFYVADESIYPPACTAGDNAGCNISFLGPYLVPKYLSVLPTTLTTLSYVRGAPSSLSYALNIDYLSKTDCKTGMNVNTGWWGAGVPTC